MELTEHYSEIQEMDAEIKAISTDDLSNAHWVVDNVGVEFPILYNPDITTVADYGVYNLLGDQLTTTSTFIIDKDGVIRWMYAGTSIDDQVPTSTVLEQLRLLEG